MSSSANIPFLAVKDAYSELKAAIDSAIARVLESGHFILGPEVEAFEREFARYAGARHCIGVGNGLDAITLSLLAHGIGPGDEVLVPSNTFIATWLGATHAGATPMPVEPDFGTHVVDVARLERAITRRTRAIIPVHLYGLPVDMPAICELCRQRALVLIDDAAQAHGASVGPTRIGGFGNTSTWSFYPGKNLGALGDAGAVTTDDDEIAGRLRQLRNYGATAKYVHDMVGFNTRLDPIQAAVLRVKLEHLDEWNARRRRLAALYDEALTGVGDLLLPQVPTGRSHAYHLYVVRTSRRDALRNHLEEEGIGTLVHYPRPPHLQAAYENAGIDSAALVATARVANEVLSLPMGPHMTDLQLEKVSDTIRGFFTKKS